MLNSLPFVTHIALHITTKIIFNKICVVLTQKALKFIHCSSAPLPIAKTPQNKGLVDKSWSWGSESLPHPDIPVNGHLCVPKFTDVTHISLAQDSQRWHPKGIRSFGTHPLMCESQTWLYNQVTLNYEWSETSQLACHGPCWQIPGREECRTCILQFKKSPRSLKSFSAPRTPTP